MKYKKQSLTEILNELKKENSGIILGNGFCTWLYNGSDKKQQKRFKDGNWKLRDIIDDTTKLFFDKYDKNIDAITLKDDDIDRIYHALLETENKSLADQWLIYFLNQILKRVNHYWIKNSPNLYKLKKILEKIEYKFTTNYDPSFYWTIMKIKKLLPQRTSKQIQESKRGGRTIELDDGFDNKEGELKFTESEKCKVFYLHGAIFLKKEIEKITGKNTKKALVSTCQEYLKSVLNLINNDFPLIIVIGRNKNEDIQKNYYLSLGLKKLISCSQIITFGLSFSEDLHLLENIIKECKNSKEVKYLYVGCYNLETDNSIRNPRVNFEQYFNDNNKPDNLNIIFYEAKDIENLNI